MNGGAKEFTPGKFATIVGANGKFGLIVRGMKERVGCGCGLKSECGVIGG